jgi:hypothetical protein
VAPTLAYVFHWWGFLDAPEQAPAKWQVRLIGVALVAIGGLLIAAG